MHFFEQNWPSFLSPLLSSSLILSSLSFSSLHKTPIFSLSFCKQSIKTTPLSSIAAMNTFYAPEKELPSQLLLPTHTNPANHATTRRAGFLSARFAALRAYFTLEGTYDAVTRCVRIVTQLTQIVSLGFILVWVMKVGAEAVLGVCVVLSSCYFWFLFSCAKQCTSEWINELTRHLAEIMRLLTPSRPCTSLVPLRFCRWRR